MADVQAVFGTLLALGIAFPGMLLAGWLMFPQVVERAGARIQQTPGRTLVMGLASAVILALPITLFLALPFGPAKFVGGALLITSLGVSSLGAAGLASVMSRGFHPETNEGQPGWRAFLGGAVALELAAAFPLVGWLLFLPLALFTSVGAASFALLRWAPGSSRAEGAGMTEGRLAHEPQSA